MRNKIKQRLEEYLRIYLIFEIDYLKIPLNDFLESVFKAGLKSIQLRCKNNSIKERYEIGLVIKKHIHKKDILFIVNDRIDLAVILHAHGYHIGLTDLPLIPSKRHFPYMIAGYSCHSKNDICYAKKGSADYIGIGSIFPTKTKSNVDHILGVDGLSYLANFAKGIPSVAIGGINCSNLTEISQIPLTGFAISSAICSSLNPGEVVKKMHRMISYGK
jgi:thiamine-phosphate pyrophosphorylase